MFGLGNRAIGIDNTVDPPLYSIMQRGLRRYELVRAGTWPPKPLPKNGVNAVLLPFCSPKIQISVSSSMENAVENTEILARSEPEGLIVTGHFEQDDLPRSPAHDFPFSRLVYDICGLSLRHLIETHPVVLDGSPVVAIDWAPDRLLLVGMRGGRTAFCSYRAVPRNPGNLTRELLRWSGEGLHILLCGAGLRTPDRIVHGLSSPSVSIELLDPGELLGVQLDVTEPWRYGLCISMALGWVLAKKRDAFLMAEQDGGGKNSPWFGWVLPLALLAVGTAGVYVGEKVRRESTSGSPSVVKEAPSSQAIAKEAEMNWQRLLLELAKRRPRGSSLLSVNARAVSGEATVDLFMRSNQEDGGSVFVESLIADGLFDHGIVHKIRAHKPRKEAEHEETVFDCDIHLEARVTR